MTIAFDDLQPRRDGVTIPAIWVAVGLSILLHVLVISGWLPWLRLPAFEQPMQEMTPPLTVELQPPPGPPAASPAPRVSPPPVPAREARPPAPRPQPPSAATKPPAEPPVLTQKEPAPAAAPPGDFAAMVEARRRARGDPAPPDAPPATTGTTPTEDEAARRNRIASTNINPQGPIAFGYDPSRSGGVFHIERMTSDYAEFRFVGWHIEAKRRVLYRIEVSRGNNPDIQTAVVRRVIAIIRDYEPGDFRWDSFRLGASVTLSARPRDQAALEAFLMEEFFSRQKPVR